MTFGKNDIVIEDFGEGDNVVGLLGEPSDAHFGLDDPNEVKEIAKGVLDIANIMEVPITTMERNYSFAKSLFEHQKRGAKRLSGIAKGLFDTMQSMPSPIKEGYEALGTEDLPAIHPKVFATEISKGMLRFLEDAAGHIGGTMFDWIGQFIEQGGLYVFEFSALGSKNPDQIYNPLANDIIATGQQISASGKAARQEWVKMATTGWEALDPALKETDPISYGAGRISEGVMSSAFSVLAMYLSGGSSVALSQGVNINRGLLALSGLSAAGGFEHAQATGENFLWSTVHGLADGTIEYAMESKFLEGVRTQGALTTGVKEAAEEFYTGMMQNTRSGTLENINVRGMTTYDGARTAMSDALRQSPWEVAAGFIGGAGMAGGMNLVQLAKKSITLPPIEAKPPPAVPKEAPQRPIQPITPPEAVKPPITPTEAVAVAPEAKAEPVVVKLKKTIPKAAKVRAKEVIQKEKEKRDLLGGVDPLHQIQLALKEAKQVRPLTEIKKKEALRKRVGAAAGALARGLKKGVSAEKAIQQSSGLLKGPLTEYNQVFESIEDRLAPGAKDAAILRIATHPDLQYFEVLNTYKSFDKLIQGSDLTPGDVQNIERVFGKTFEEFTKPREQQSELYDKIITLWKAGLLTGIKTQGLNALANTGHAVTETAKDIPAVLVDKMVSVVTGKRTIGLTVKGVATGTKQGIIRGWKYLKTGHDSRNIGAKLDYKRVNFGDSKIAKALQAYEETIFHLLGAADQPFYYGAKARSIYSQAIAEGKNKKLKGKELKAFVEKKVENPTDEMLEWSVYDAEIAVFQNRTHLGDIAKSIQKVKGGEVVVPFGRTPAAVATQIINYSPVGIIKEVAQEIHQGKFNQRKFSQAFGRTAVGTGSLYIGTLLLKAGLMTLDHPDNERERELWKLEGRSANSIKIGDKWRSVHTLGPVGNVLLIGGHFQKALNDEGSPTKAIVTAMAGGAKSFSEQTFVRGVNMAVDAIVSPERSFENWFSSMAGSLVPTIVADFARANDIIERRAIGPIQRVQKRIPFLREDLPPAIDVFGQDLPRYGGNVLEVMADPTRPSKVRQDIVVDELRRLFDKDIKVSPTLLGDKAGFDILTAEENTQLWRRAGELTYKYLFQLVDLEEYKSANNAVKGKFIDVATGNAKAAAKAEIVNIKLLQGKTVLELAESGLLNIESLEMLQYYKDIE